MGYFVGWFKVQKLFWVYSYRPAVPVSREWIKSDSIIQLKSLWLVVVPTDDLVLKWTGMRQMSWANYSLQFMNVVSSAIIRNNAFFDMTHLTFLSFLSMVTLQKHVTHINP